MERYTLTEKDEQFYADITAEVPQETWDKCTDNYGYAHGMFQCLIPMIRSQEKVMREQGEELQKAGAMKKAKYKKKIRHLDSIVEVLNDKLDLCISDLRDLLHTNALMIVKLKENDLYDNEATAFPAPLTSEAIKAAIENLQTGK